MINSDAKLSDKIFTETIEKAPTRDGFGNGSVIEFDYHWHGNPPQKSQEEGFIAQVRDAVKNK